jgi:hypothetical protein
MRATLAVLSLAALFFVAPVSARAQETGVRFPITQVGDTTFSFRLGDQAWVRSGLRGIVVDPRQQDMLVARFRVTSVSGGVANAVVTGQTTSLSVQHSALLDIPQRPWYKDRLVWIGGAVGAAVGFLLGSL